MTFYIGADLDSRSAMMSALNEAGDVVNEKRGRTRPEDVLRFMRIEKLTHAYDDLIRPI